MHFIKLPTGKIIKVSSFCVVSLGRASNIWHKLEVVTKAGHNRLKGIRPSVRGVAMNPVDHPHGGRSKTPKPEVTPWGKIAKKRH
jgi:large subunit ribosomal protein L2